MALTRGRGARLGMRSRWSFLAQAGPGRTFLRTYIGTYAIFCRKFGTSRGSNHMPCTVRNLNDVGISVHRKWRFATTEVIRDIWPFSAELLQF